MLIYLTLCVISMLSPCFTIRPDISALVSVTDEDSKPIENIGLWSILRPVYQNSDEEDVSDVSNEPVEAELPKLTIWEFPDERRAFIGDVEVFINSTEASEYSNEAIDPQNAIVSHPHKNHHIHLNLTDAKTYPPFRIPKSKRTYTEEVKDNIVISNQSKRSIKPDMDYLIEYLSKINRYKRNIHKKITEDTENDFIIHHEDYSGPTKVRQRRFWGLYEYLKSLLSEADEGTINDLYPPNSSNDNQNEQSNNIEAVTSNNNQNDAAELETTSENPVNGINLVPENPDIIEAILEEYNKYRRKRSIESENSINLLQNDSDEHVDSKDYSKIYIDSENNNNDNTDSNNDGSKNADFKIDLKSQPAVDISPEDINVEILEDFIKFLRASQDFYAVLIAF